MAVSSCCIPRCTTFQSCICCVWAVHRLCKACVAVAKGLPMILFCNKHIVAAFCSSACARCQELPAKQSDATTQDVERHREPLVCALVCMGMSLHVNQLPLTWLWGTLNHLLPYQACRQWAEATAQFISQRQRWRLTGGLQQLTGGVCGCPYRPCLVRGFSAFVSMLWKGVACRPVPSDIWPHRHCHSGAVG